MEQVIAESESKNEWLDPKAQAVFLGVSLSQVYSFMKQVPPPYPFYRITPSKRLSKRVDLETYLEKVKVSAVMQNLERDQ